MRIVVGLPGGCTDREIDELVEAGAGEFFVGYAPPCWSERFGFEFSPNRRYRRSAQVTDRERLAVICARARVAGIPVSVTFNEHFVTPAAWELGRRLLDEALGAGISAVIVADPAIIAPLRRHYPTLPVQLSGDAGIYNCAGVEAAAGAGIARVIFPRELPSDQMAAILGRYAGPELEWEAFIMGEPCRYDGSRCFTEHGYGFACDFCNAHQGRMLHRRSGPSTRLEPPLVPAPDSDEERAAWSLGRCGLCAVTRLEQLGITHLKVPGRSSMALPAVRLVRKALAGANGPELLGTPRICRSRQFCYYPELADG